MTNSFKMLPGHVFTIEKDAVLTADKINVYASFDDVVSIYPQYMKGLNTAKIILRGTLTLSSISGQIYTDTENAQFKASSSINYKTYEATNNKGGTTGISFGKTVLYYTTDVNSFPTSGGVSASKNATYKVVNGVWTKV